MAQHDVLEVTLNYRDINWLFQVPDISPFEEDFDKRSTTPGIEYIANELRANPSLKRVETTVILPAEQVVPGLAQQTMQAVQRYCDAQCHILRQEERKLLRRAARSLAFAIMAVLISVGVSAPLAASDSFVLRVIGEGLYFLGWVAFWFPINSLVFDAPHLRMDMKSYERVMEMQLTIRPRENTEPR